MNPYLFALFNAGPVNPGMKIRDPGVLAADRVLPLLAVVAAHLGMILWLALALERSEPALSAPAAVMAGVLLAPPAPLPVVEPPKPLPVKRPEERRKPEPVPPPVVQETPAVVEQAVTPPETALSEPVPEPVPPAGERVPEPETPQVVPPRVDASRLDNPAPPYPAVSRQLREQGRVLLDVYILPDGSVGEIRLRESCGYPRLDRSALEAVRHWRYLPARRGTEPIPYWYVQPILFSLTNAR